MKKLFKLEKWLTLAEASKYLSSELKEEVGESDVLKLVVEGRLKLSVKFDNYIFARKGKIIGDEGDDSNNLPLALNRYPPLIKTIISEQSKTTYKDGINCKNKFVLEQEVVRLTGVYEMSMLGCERLEIKKMYQVKTNGPAVHQNNSNGILIKDEDNAIYQLLEINDLKSIPDGSIEKLLDLEHKIEKLPFDSELAKSLTTIYNHHRKIYNTKYLEASNSSQILESFSPILEFPNTCIWVFQNKSLREFMEAENKLNNIEEKPIGTTERNTLLTIIEALCRNSDLDTKARGTAIKIAKMTDSINAPITDDTIRAALFKIQEAVDRRMK